MKIRKIKPDWSSEAVSFDWEYQTPSWIVSWTSVQEWIDLHFQSINPLVSVNLLPNNSLREYWNDIVNPNISANITDWANPVGTIVDIKYYRGTAAWTLLHSWTETTFQDTFTVSSYQKYTITIEDSEWRTASWNKAYSFVYPFFWWVISDWDVYNNIDYTELSNLPWVDKNISTKWNKTVTTSPSSQRYLFMYPSSYWTLSSIIDTNGFETIWDYDVFDYSVTNMLDWSSTPYKVYILKSDTSQTDFINTYKF